MRSPGSAPAGALARGSALFDGMISSPTPPRVTCTPGRATGARRRRRWTLPGTPPAVTAALAAAVAPLAASDRPPALLAAGVNPPRFPFRPRLREVTACDIGLLTPVAEIALSVAGPMAGLWPALAASRWRASPSRRARPGVVPARRRPSPAKQPIDEIVVIAPVARAASWSSAASSARPSPARRSASATRSCTRRRPMTAPPAPAKPVTIFRRRDAEVDPSGPSIVARSYFDVQWASPLLTPLTSPATRSRTPWRCHRRLGTVGYLAQRGDGDLAAAESIPRIIAAAPQPTPSDSPLLPAAAILRFADAGLPDPGTGYQHRTAGFGLFGQLGPYSDWGDPRGVERIAAAPALRLLTVGAAQTPSTTARPAAAAQTIRRTRRPGSGERSRPSPRGRAAACSDTPTCDRAAERNGGRPGVDGARHDRLRGPGPERQAYTLTLLVPDTGGASSTRSPIRRWRRSGQRPGASLTLTGVLDDGTTSPSGSRSGPASSTRPPSAPGGVVATLPGGSSRA